MKWEEKLFIQPVLSDKSVVEDGDLDSSLPGLAEINQQIAPIK